MPDLDKTMERAEAIIALVRQLPDPFAWPRSFRTSCREFRSEGEKAGLIDDVQPMREAIRSFVVERGWPVMWLTPSRSGVRRAGSLRPRVLEPRPADSERAWPS